MFDFTVNALGLRDYLLTHNYEELWIAIRNTWREIMIKEVIQNIWMATEWWSLSNSLLSLLLDIYLPYLPPLYFILLCKQLVEILFMSFVQCVGAFLCWVYLLYVSILGAYMIFFLWSIIDFSMRICVTLNFEADFFVLLRTSLLEACVVQTPSGPCSLECWSISQCSVCCTI